MVGIYSGSAIRVGVFLPKCGTFLVAGCRISQTTTITVEATDQDDDPLSYIWSTNLGIVPSGNQGPTIEYIAPSTKGVGIDTIKVTVTDGKGGSITKKATIAIENRD